MDESDAASYLFPRLEATARANLERALRNVILKDMRGLLKRSYAVDMHEVRLLGSEMMDCLSCPEIPTIDSRFRKCLVMHIKSYTERLLRKQMTAFTMYNAQSIVYERAKKYRTRFSVSVSQGHGCFQLCPMVEFGTNLLQRLVAKHVEHVLTIYGKQIESVLDEVISDFDKRLICVSQLKDNVRDDVMHLLSAAA